MWYKVAISKEDADRLNIDIDRYFKPSKTDYIENVDQLKKQLIDKYGEDYRNEINDKILQLNSELSFNRLWESGPNVTNLHGMAPGINAFYILPDGTLTPNLSSHVSFDNMLLQRLGFGNLSFKDRSDRHVLSDLVGAVRVNITGDSRNATIYYPMTKEQKARLEDLNISSYDYRNDLTSDTPATNENDELFESLENLGKQLSSIGSSLEDILSKYVNTQRNPKFSVETAATEPYTIQENVQNIDENLFNKLAEIKDRFSNLEIIADDLRGIRS